MQLDLKLNRQLKTNYETNAKSTYTLIEFYLKITSFSNRVIEDVIVGRGVK